MPQIYKPVIERITTDTRHGEITVNLNISLTMKVEDGQLTIAASSSATPKVPAEKEKKEDFKWQIPEIDTNTQVISFGKDVDE